MRISDWSSDVCASDLAVLLLTFGLTVLVDLTVAVAVGVTLASLLFMARMAEAVEVGSGGPRDPELDAEDIDQRDDLPPGVEVFRIAGPFFFGVAGELLDTLRRLGQSPRVIILRLRSEEHTSELPSLMRISYAVFCLKKKNKN